MPDDTHELDVQYFSANGQLIATSSSYYDWWYDITWPSAFLTFFPVDAALIVRVTEYSGDEVLGYSQDIRAIPAV